MRFRAAQCQTGRPRPAKSARSLPESDFPSHQVIFGLSHNGSTLLMCALRVRPVGASASGDSHSHGCCVCFLPSSEVSSMYRLVPRLPRRGFTLIELLVVI